MVNIGTCSKCDEKNVKIVMHRIDYENDITVPMCYPCHLKLHAELRRNGIPLSPPYKNGRTSSQIEVSDKVKKVLLNIQERDGHKAMDSVVRTTLIRAGEMEA